MWSVAREPTDRQTHTKVKTEDTLSGFRKFFLQPIIKDWSNYEKPNNIMINAKADLLEFSQLQSCSMYTADNTLNMVANVFASKSPFTNRMILRVSFVCDSK